jgi:hypothetical protein
MKKEEFDHTDEEAIISLIIILCTKLREYSIHASRGEER